MKLYFVYKTVNLVSRREYIGIHESHDLFFGTPESHDDYIGNTIDLARDLKKYGRKAFYVEAIHAFPLEHDARKYLEKLLKDQLPGSYNDLPKRPTENYRAMSLGEKNSFFGKKHSAETLNVLSEYRKGMRWINNGVSVRQIGRDDPIPEGWVAGRGSRTLKSTPPGGCSKA